MYAIFSAGGKQHRVSEGDILRIDLQSGKTPGDAIEFSDVLFVKSDAGYSVGTPTVAGAKVSASVVNNGEAGEGVKDKKIYVFKRRRRQGYRKLQGHRQRYTEIKIEKISV